jgi:hypothetical protein
MIRGSQTAIAVRPSAVLAIALGLIAAVANAADLFFLDFFGPLIVLPYALGSFVGVGCVLALLRPRHPVGWLFLVCGGCFALQWTLGAYSWRALVDAPGTLPAGELAAWVTALMWIPAVGSVMLAVVLFPTGRLPSRRWVPILVVAVAVLAAMMLTRAFAPAPVAPMSAFDTALGDAPADGSSGSSFPNPVGAGGVLGDALLAATPFLEAATGVPILFVVLASLVVRYRRSTGTERQQLKWFFFAASLSFMLILGSFVGPKGLFANLSWAAGTVGLGLIPIAAGIAILRYRLYDIDVLIRRTLIYAAVLAVLAVAYLGVIALTQSLLAPFTAGSSVAVAVSTLAVVALFQPVLRRIRSAVDRRFYRSKYDAERTLDAFAARLREQIDLGALEAELLLVVDETLQPARASMWLR